MKLLLTLLLTSSLFATDLYFDIGRYSDDGGETKHQLFKIQNFDVENDDSLTCYFQNEQIIKYEVNLLKVANTYVFGVNSDSDSDLSNAESYTSAIDLNDLILMNSSSDGYVMENLIVGSKDKIEKFNKALIALSESSVDLESYELLDAEKVQQVTLQNENYEFSCERESDDY